MTWRSFRRWWLVAFALGIVGALLWWGFTDTATWTITKDGASTTDDQTRRQFGMVVNFVVIGAGLSLLLGLSVAITNDVTWPAVPAVALMAGLAAELTWLIGVRLGPDRPSAKHPVGTVVHDALAVPAVAPFLAWSVFAVAGLLFGVWMFGDRAAADLRLESGSGLPEGARPPSD